VGLVKIPGALKTLTHPFRYIPAIVAGQPFPSLMREGTMFNSCTSKDIKDNIS